MRNIVFLNLINNNSYTELPLTDKDSVPQMVKAFLSELPDVNKIIPLALRNEQFKSYDLDQDNLILFQENSQKLLLQKMYDLSEGYDNCIYLFGDCPFLDIDLFHRMYENHNTYFADYSFADGYPFGLSPEILTPKCIKDLVNLSAAEEKPIERDSIFSWIQKDINAFDIETTISPVDLRMKRIQLTADSKINYLQLKKYTDMGIRSASDFMNRSDELELRAAPNYYQIQIASSCLQSCSYCPYPEMNPNHLKSRDIMEASDVIKLAKAIEAYTPEAMVSLSLWGEPSTHPEITRILESLEKETSLHYIMETSGLGWGESFETLSPFSSDRFNWIISLDSMNKDVYRKLRGEGLNEVLSFIEKMLTINSSNTWIQAVRMRDNENDLEDFYRYWKERTDNVIIQKYDHFSEKLESRKLTDLSPLKRSPCWHLKREMTILPNGNVILCREDIEGKHIWGNCFESSLEELWEQGQDNFQDQVNEKYNGICANCDEYYCFNF